MAPIVDDLTELTMLDGGERDDRGEAGERFIDSSAYEMRISDELCEAGDDDG